jgi:ribosome-binding protein aMBF1 (putative translation factor)
MNIELFKKALDASGLSRNALAKKANVNLSTVSRLADGRNLNITADTVRKLEKVLGLKKGDLL